MNSIKKLYRKIFFVSPGLMFVNFIIQRVFRINSKVKFQTHYTSQFRYSENLYVSDDIKVLFSRMSGLNIQARNGIYIDEGTIVASNVSIFSSNHNLDDLWFGEEPKCRPVKIGKKCWIGGGVIILPGSQLGDGVIVGAGSVVTKSFEGNVIIAGNPAKIIRYR